MCERLTGFSMGFKRVIEQFEFGLQAQRLPIKASKSLG